MAAGEDGAARAASGRDGPAPARQSRLTRQRIRSAWLFLTPMLIVLALVAGWPLLSAMYLSLTDRMLTANHDTQFVGFRNYLYYGPNLDGLDPETGEFYVYYPPTESDLIYRAADETFIDLATDRPYAGDIDTALVFQWQGALVDSLWWRSVANTVIFAVTSVSLELVLGLVIALVLNANLPGRGLLRAAILIPWAIPTIVSAQMWGWMLNDQYGVINEILLWLGWIESRLAFTAQPALALPSVIAVDVWKTTPFMALLILAALQMLPGELYEAARVDGVHPVRQFFRITLPLIRPAIMVAVIFRALDALRIFDLIYVLTSGSRDTMSMSVYARQNLVDFQNVGYGSAISTMLFLIIAFFTIAYIMLGRLNLTAER